VLHAAVPMLAGRVAYFQYGLPSSLRRPGVENPALQLSMAHFNGLPSLRITATAAALDTHGRLKDLKLLQDLFFLVTTSLCQDWVTCLHAAFLTCGNRFYHSGLSVQGPSLDLRYPSFACSANTLPSEAAR